MASNNVHILKLVEQFVEMARISSPSRREGRFAAYMQQELAALGFSVIVDEAGRAVGGDTGNIIATLPGTAAREPLVFCCHLDTVQPCDNIQPIVDNGVIRTDGTTILSGDDKGGIAALLAAIRLVQQSGAPHGPLQVVLTIGEEAGMLGAKNLAYEAIKATNAVIFDAEGEVGDIVVQGPAKNSINAVVHGRTAHAGLHPEEGVSAIQVAARAIDRMKLLRIDEDTTANIGTISGGAATNIVAGETTVTAEARSLSNAKLETQSRHMADCFRAAAAEFGVTADVEVASSYAAYQVPAHAPLVKRCQEVMTGLGLTPRLVATGGGSDCNVFNARGITAIDIAIGMTAAHTVHESIRIADLAQTARLMAALLTQQ